MQRVDLAPSVPGPVGGLGRAEDYRMPTWSEERFGSPESRQVSCGDRERTSVHRQSRTLQERGRRAMSGPSTLLDPVVDVIRGELRSWAARHTGEQPD